jgi:hypothetical protein
MEIVNVNTQERSIKGPKKKPLINIQPTGYILITSLAQKRLDIKEGDRLEFGVESGGAYVRKNGTNGFVFRHKKNLEIMVAYVSDVAKKIGAGSYLIPEPSVYPLPIHWTPEKDGWVQMVPKKK